jgi:hypothetical protein
MKGVLGRRIFLKDNILPDGRQDLLVEPRDRVIKPRLNRGFLMEKVVSSIRISKRTAWPYKT